MTGEARVGRVRALVVGYHDVQPVREGDHTVSGFGTPGSQRYSMQEPSFRAHLASLAAVPGWTPSTVRGLADVLAAETLAAITVDDGGDCAAHVADLLEEQGWRGHFFVVTSLMGTAGFAGRRTLVDLAARGHVVGTHSRTHPDAMASMSPDRLREEWLGSVETLQDVLGAPVTTGSVPGGSTSRLVERQAAAAGLQVLFTSDPINRVTVRDGCAVIGRYQLYGSDGPEVAAAVARSDRWFRWRRSAAWGGRRLVQRMLGPQYLRLRRTLLGQGNVAVRSRDGRNGDRACG